MTIESWLQAAIADAERRGLPELKPLLETLAQATRVLRDADVPARHPVLNTREHHGASASRAGVGPRENKKSPGDDRRADD